MLSTDEVRDIYTTWAMQDPNDKGSWGESYDRHNSEFDEWLTSVQERAWNKGRLVGANAASTGRRA